MSQDTAVREELPESVNGRHRLQETGVVNALSVSEFRSKERFQEKLEQVETRVLAGHLSDQFVFAEDVAAVIARGLRTGQNVLLWGEGGYGKSEMTQAALKILGMAEDSYLQDFGAGMEEAELWGGIDVQRFTAGEGLFYQTDRSFIRKPVAVFEEFLDAPNKVVTALKQTLSSKKLSKNGFEEEINTHIVIGITNHNPGNFRDEGSDRDALIQRFPLQLEVKWPAHDASTYRNLFDVKDMGSPEIRQQFAELVAGVCSNVGEVPPREALAGLKTVLDGMTEMGGGEQGFQAECYNLRLLPKFREAGLQAKDSYEQRMSELLMNDVKAALADTAEELKKVDTEIDVLGALARLRGFDDTLAQIQFSDAENQKLQGEVKKTLSSYIESAEKKYRKFHKAKRSK